MRRSTLVLGVVAAVAVVAAVVLGVLYATKDSEESAAPPVDACEDRIFGHIASLEPASAGGYELRLDPAWFTLGVTANTAAAEDGVVEPGEAVPNDNYRVDEGDRLLTYIVPANTKVTVLTNEGDPPQIGATSITPEQLSQLVAGETPIELYEPLETGVWVSYHVDTTCAIDHQYQP